MIAERNLHPSFQKKQYLFRRKVFKIFGGAFHIYDQDMNLMFFAKQKAFKLKEDIRIYSDESQTDELLTIKTPQILDIVATYNVTDATTGEPVGAIRRRGIKAIVKDEWIFLSNDGQEIGKLTEKNAMSAIMSRLIKLIPQKYIVVLPDSREITEIKQHFNPFVLKYTMDITEGVSPIDPRLLIAAGILLASIERRQE